MVRKFHIEYSWYLLAAAWLLILPLRWGIAAMTAAWVHEFCHYAAIRLTGGQVLKITLKGGGAVMETTPADPAAEALRAIAGPAGSFAMAALIRWFPEAVLWGLVQGVYNLLPVYPLDGGRVMRCLFPGKVCDAVERITVFLLIALGTIGAVIWDLGVLPVLVFFLMAGKWKQRKIPCKETKLGVQ